LSTAGVKSKINSKTSHGVHEGRERERKTPLLREREREGGRERESKAALLREREREREEMREEEGTFVVVKSFKGPNGISLGRILLLLLFF
jgi:hypothetical protein